MQTVRKHFMDLRQSPRRLLTGLLATFGALPLTGSSFSPKRLVLSIWPTSPTIEAHR